MDPTGAYRRYVEAVLSDPPESPFRETFGGWVLGSVGFLERLRTLAGPVSSDPPLREARELARLATGTILAAVTEYCDLEADSLRRRHDRMVQEIPLEPSGLFRLGGRENLTTQNHSGSIPDSEVAQDAVMVQREMERPGLGDKVD